MPQTILSSNQTDDLINSLVSSEIPLVEESSADPGWIQILGRIPAGESVSEPDPNAAVFHIIILNSPHAAHKYKLSGWVSGGALAHASKRHMLLATKSVIQQVIAEVNDRSPLPLESSEFLQAFFEEFGTKLGFFLHSLDDPRDL
jgi:hypothetical protein